MFPYYNCVVHFTEPTLLKLSLYLKEVKEWEEFGMCLLPEADLHILKVNVCLFSFSVITVWDQLEATIIQL